MKIFKARLASFGKRQEQKEEAYRLFITGRMSYLQKKISGNGRTENELGNLAQM